MKNLSRVLLSLIVASRMVPFAGADTTVYATTFPDGYSTLGQIDLATGAFTALGTVNYGGIVNDIAADPLNGSLYGLSGGNLFTINPKSGS